MLSCISSTYGSILQEKIIIDKIEKINIGNYSGCNTAIVLKAAKTFCPFLIQVSVTERMTA
jgi:hypothetical protein